jgi:hypothetical protein
MRQQIAHYSQSVPGASVAFEPHVTVVGGFEWSSRDIDQADNNNNNNNNNHSKLVQVLQQGLSDFGRVHMSLLPGKEDEKFQVKGQPAATACWSQALYLPMQQSDDFIALCRLTRKLLHLDTTASTSTTTNGTSCEQDHFFPPPAREPHLSLCYAHDVPESAFCEARQSLQNMMMNNNKAENKNNNNNDPFSFEAETLVLYQTDPASVAGVAQWKELAMIDLCSRSSSRSSQPPTTTAAATVPTTTTSQ